jgi:hypothetical protein
MVWVSPLLVQLWLIAAAQMLPQAPAALLLISGFNLSVFIFFVVSTVCLWHHEPTWAPR